MLHDALRLIRVFYDLPQKELAARLQIAPSYLSEIESGKKEPTLTVLRKYAEQFEIPLSSIMFFSENMETGAHAGKVKAAVSSKVIALLQFIAVKAGRDAA